MSVEDAIAKIQAKVGTLSGAGLDLSAEYDELRDEFVKVKKTSAVKPAAKPAAKKKGK